MTIDEIIAAQMEENAAIRQARLDATPLTPEEKAARQVLLAPQIKAQHDACLALPANAAKIQAIRDARA